MNDKKRLLQYNYLRITLVLFFLGGSIFMVRAQEHDKIDAYSTFGATRIALTQSVETTTKGVLNFDIQHQFGAVNSGISQFFGLDQATTRLGLNYGLSQWLTLGIGRAGLLKTYDGSIKIKFKTQAAEEGFPFSIVYFGDMGISTSPWNYTNVPYYFSSRLTYTNQLLIARRFGDHFSMQLSPTFIHRNFVESNKADNDIWDVGIAARYLFGENYSITADYHYIMSPYTSNNFNNSLTLGFNILISGHVFSLYATNSMGILEQQFVPETKGSWLKGDIHFGFSIVRSFVLREPDYF